MRDGDYTDLYQKYKQVQLSLEHEEQKNKRAELRYQKFIESLQ